MSAASLTRLIILVMFVFPAGLLAIVLLQTEIDPQLIFLDALDAAERVTDCCHVSYGLVSNTGIILWFGTGAVCIVAGLAVLVSTGQDRFTRFALSTGVLSGWLGLDDMFMVHERVMPKLGVPQEAVMLVYMMIALIYAALNWRFIFSETWWILALSGVALGLSMSVDQFIDGGTAIVVYVEDGAKLFGIVCWSAFHVLAVMHQLADRINSAPAKFISIDRR